MTDEQKLSAINEIVKQLRDEETGLSSLKKLITNALIQDYPSVEAANKHILATTEWTEHEPREHLEAFIWCVLFEKIHDNENKKKQKSKEYKTPELFKETIVDEIKEIIKTIPKLSKDDIEKTTNHYDDKREKLNGTPEIFTEYGFTTSCTNGAAAFIQEYTKDHPEQKNNVKFLFSTVWDHLLDGKSGHTVACVKLDTGDWVMIEPRNPTVPENQFTGIIPKSEFQVGKPLKHLMKHRNGEPYMITKILDKPYTKHQDFLQDASRVKLSDAKKFLAQAAKEEYLSPEMRTKIERELKILSNLTPEEQKLPEKELQEIIEKKRKIQSLRLATDKLGKQVQLGPYVSMDELKKAQARQAYFGHANLHE